ncbi:MAG: hypothetical protein F9K24_21675 [Leptonema illini]|uniref:Phosphohistidine phosphatase n=1 Tax=Leptonema illini TaxID=183 RepID=A0A833LUU7_9LEPT|nr:MAG: hypothetical protein F9K24_21675 [Leptonema illini]
MKDLLEKLSTYNILNYLIPGGVFVELSSSLTTYNLTQDDIVKGVILYYFVGLVISRIGSMLVEPILRWSRFVHFADYQDYLKASEKDSRLEVLSEENNMFRTFIALFLSLVLFKAFEVLSACYPCLNDWLLGMIILGLISLFAFSYRKRTYYITKRVKAANSKN